MTETKLDPSKTSTAYRRMCPSWDKIETILAGTEAMRRASKKYLPKHVNEKDEAYDNRLVQATLLNMTQLTLDTWVGRPFSDPVKVGKDVPEALRSILDDVDLQGNRFNVFARNWFREGVAKAFAHVLVDFPDTSTSASSPRSIADDQREGVRPYWTFVKPENLIAESAAVVDGREVLTHVRIREQVVLQDGFDERVVNRIRIFDRLLPGESATPGVIFSLWELRKGEKEEAWIPVQPPARLDIDEIPLVTFYADRQGLMYGKSPLEDLVDLNIRHWQSTSEQIDVLTAARFPILAASGVTEDENRPVLVGPHRCLTTPDPQGRWYYVEHTGAAIAAGRQDLADLEAQMAHYGAEFLTKRPGSTSATARALDSAEATSPLEDAVVRFNDALNQALSLTAKWMGLAEGGTLEVSTDFGPEEPNAADFQALQAARQGRDISRETFLDELKRRGTLADTFDPDADLEQLRSEDLLGSPTDGKPMDGSGSGPP